MRAVANQHSGPVPVVGEPMRLRPGPGGAGSGALPPRGHRSPGHRSPGGRAVLDQSALDRTARTGPPGREIEEVADVRLAQTFEAFYGLARDGIAKVLTVTLGDAELATEATDEAMVRAYQRWDRIGTMDNPGGWVYRVALNWATSRLRGARRAGRRRVEHEPSVAAPPVFEPAVDRALAELSVDHRAVVVCRYLLGWSEARTAEALGLRPGTVKSRLSRASQILQHHLAPLRDDRGGPR